MNNIGNNGNIDNIVICVFPHICSFLLNSNHIVLVNAKLYITRYRRIIFQARKFWWPIEFQMAQLKHKLQYCHSCTAGSFWKPRFCASGSCERVPMYIWFTDRCGSLSDGYGGWDALLGWLQSGSRRTPILTSCTGRAALRFHSAVVAVATSPWSVNQNVNKTIQSWYVTQFSHISEMRVYFSFMWLRKSEKHVGEEKILFQFIRKFNCCQIFCSMPLRSFISTWKWSPIYYLAIWICQIWNVLNAPMQTILPHNFYYQRTPVLS